MQRVASASAARSTAMLIRSVTSMPSGVCHQLFGRIARVRRAALRRHAMCTAASVGAARSLSAGEAADHGVSWLSSRLTRQQFDKALPH